MKVSIFTFLVSSFSAVASVQGQGGGGGQPPMGGGGGGRQECSCTVDADPSEARYEESVSSNDLTIRTAGIPNHVFHEGRQQVNPNVVCAQPSETTLPVQPERSGSFSSTPLGVIGILKTGGFLYNHLSNPNGQDDVANHPNNEQPSLDTCHGHADGSCTYHYHEISQLAACTHDGKWDECELIGYVLDGFPLYSHCFSLAEDRYLKSCYAIASDTDNDEGADTSDYSHSESGDCDLDAANGYDFTGKGITDSVDNEITGYAYVATDTYPYVMPLYAGTQWNSVSALEGEWPTATTDDNEDAGGATTAIPTSSPTSMPTDIYSTAATLQNTAAIASLAVTMNILWVWVYLLVL